MRIFFAQADVEGCGYYRTYLPGVALAKLPGVEVLATHEVDGARHIPWADVIVWQRQHRAELVPLRERARALGKVQVFEIDDFLDAIPEWSPQYAHYPRGCEAIRNLHDWMRSCDHLLVSTKALGEAYASLSGRPFTVSPNALDSASWRRKDNDTGRIRIGWTGSTTHERDLTEAQYAILRVLEDHPETDFVMMGYDGGLKHRLAGGSSKDAALARRIDHYPWLGDVARYPAAVAALRLDVAIAPLAPKEPFNRYRSNVKFTEFSAVEIPVVASRVEPYAEIVDGVTGMLAGDANEFHRKLERLVTDASLRRTIGANASRYVRERYAIEDAAVRLRDLFSSLVEAQAVPSR